MKTIYVPTPWRWQRYKNVDYQVSFELLKLGEYNSGLKLVTSGNLQFNCRFYSRLAIGLAREHFRLPIPATWGWHLVQNYWIPDTDVTALDADAVLSYERYPLNSTRAVIWIGGTADVEGMRRRGVTEANIQRLIDFKREANARAAVTVIPTAFKKRLFDEVIQPTNPTVVIPFFQPIQAAPIERVKAKWSRVDPIKLLFVGRAPRRKGLSLVLKAYSILQARYPHKVSLHVVTTFQDGSVEIPDIPGLTIDSVIPHARAIELMTEAHYLLMPSEREEYGFVYIEAMARGTIPVAADSPVQRDLLKEGHAGLLVARQPEALADAIASGIEQPDRARLLASQAYEFWHTQYDPAVVAQRYGNIAEAVAR
jgi:glycosyltransferase involved in cell wall biosynthesis